uniref:Uncharacterized protein n=1 Tax=Pseudomonas phage HRDY3 TaxID=3236930 RepID=A0AB39CD68_9VIRU
MIRPDSCCALCGEGQPTMEICANSSELEDTGVVVPMRYQNCPVCGSDYGGGTEMCVNADRMEIMRRVHHVSGTEFLVECEDCKTFSSPGLLKEHGCLVCKELKENK